MGERSLYTKETSHIAVGTSVMTSRKKTWCGRDGYASFLSLLQEHLSCTTGTRTWDESCGLVSSLRENLFCTTGTRNNLVQLRSSHCCENTSLVQLERGHSTDAMVTKMQARSLCVDWKRALALVKQGGASTTRSPPGCKNKERA